MGEPSASKLRYQSHKWLRYRRKLTLIVPRLLHDLPRLLHVDPGPHTTWDLGLPGRTAAPERPRLQPPLAGTLGSPDWQSQTGRVWV